MRHRLIVGTVIFSCLLCALPPTGAWAGDGYTDYITVRTLREQETASTTRWIDVPGRGSMLFYAQSNPFWADMRYENAQSSGRRQFGNAGCCPTSTAIAIANLLPKEDLGKIQRYAAERPTRGTGYGFSLGVMNPLNMRRGQGIYWLNSADEYQRYLPLVFGQYAAGNNLRRSSWRSNPDPTGESSGGTSVGFVPDLCAIYGLKYTKVPKGKMDWVEPLRYGATAVALANTTAQPFVKSKGHYVAIVGCDDQYLYVMDPQDKLSGTYANDGQGVLEVLERGLVRVKLENYSKLYFGVVYVLTNAKVEAKLNRAHQLGLSQFALSELN